MRSTNYSYTKTCSYKDKTLKLIPQLAKSSLLSLIPYHCLLRKTVYVYAYFYVLYNVNDIIKFVSQHVLNTIWYIHDILFKQNVMKKTSELNVDIFVDIAKFATIQLKAVWMDVKKVTKEIIVCNVCPQYFITKSN